MHSNNYYDGKAIINILLKAQGASMRERMLSKALEELGRKGLEGKRAFPTPYRVLWNIGLPVQPPLYCSYLKLFVVNSVFFAVTFFVLFSIRLILKSKPFDWSELMIGSAIGGTVFSLIMSSVFRYRAKKLNLPKWQSYAE